MSKVYNREDFSQHKNFCLFPFVQLYCLKSIEGFRVKPCCDTVEKEEIYANSISKIVNHSFLKEVRKHFIADNSLPDMCLGCISDEKASNGKQSKRLGAFQHNVYNKNEIDFLVDADGTLLSDTLDLDLRPSNTCNLKCIMCNPWDSSKWNEDMGVYGETFLGTSDFNDLNKIKKEINEVKQHTDWDELLEHANSLKRIFIAGGEPFYMKDAIKFLQTLINKGVASDIVLEITTNAVSVDDKLISILEKFKEVCITISIDGIKDVNYIIRYPTNWNAYCENIDMLYNKFGAEGILFNTTVSALNLLDMINILNFTSKYTKVIVGRCVLPEILDINSLKPKVIDNFSNFLSNTSVEEFYYTWLMNLLEEYKYSNKNNEKMKNYLEKLDKVRNTNSKLVLPWCWE